MRSPQNSAEPNASITFGHVFVAVQRSSRPAAVGRAPCLVALPPDHAVAPRLVHAAAPPGSANRRFIGVCARRDVRERAVPDYAVALVLVEAEVDEACVMKLPDCESPIAIAWSIAPATGFGVPAASFAAWRKNDTTSRVAARPTPSTRGSLAV